MVENVSPEERLFKVIRNEAAPPQKISGKRTFRFADGIGSVLHKLREVVTVRHCEEAEGRRSNLKTVIASGKNRPRNDTWISASARNDAYFSLQGIDLKLVNNILAIFLCVLLILAVYSIKKQPSTSKVIGAVSNNAAPALKIKPAEEFKPLSFYVEGARKRNVFYPYSQGSMAAAGSNLAVKDLGLAGIYMGQDRKPEAMIEDKAAKKTYFIKEGDELKGYKVKAILKDRVILQYGDLEMEIM